MRPGWEIARAGHPETRTSRDIGRAARPSGAGRQRGPHRQSRPRQDALNLREPRDQGQLENPCRPQHIRAMFPVDNALGPRRLGTTGAGPGGPIGLVTPRIPRVIVIHEIGSATAGEHNRPPLGDRPRPGVIEDRTDRDDRRRTSGRPRRPDARDSSDRGAPWPDRGRRNPSRSRRAVGTIAVTAGTATVRGSAGRSRGKADSGRSGVTLEETRRYNRQGRPSLLAIISNNDTSSSWPPGHPDESGAISDRPGEVKLGWRQA